MKHLKSVLLIGCCLLLSVPLSGCQNDKPKPPEVVANCLALLDNQQYVSALSYTINQTSLSKDYFQENIPISSMMDLLTTYFTHFQYEAPILNTLTDKTATVDITMTTVDCPQLIAQHPDLATYVAEQQPLLLTSELIETLTLALDDDALPLLTKTVTVSLTKPNNGWYIILDDQLINDCTGGLMDVLNQHSTMIP